MIYGLDLFSGIGGIALALRDWVRPVAYCEIDGYCQKVLQRAFKAGCLVDAPIWDDVKTLDGAAFRGKVDIITGGFPCQDISVAGNGAGLDGERSGLVFEIFRLVREIRPAFIFLENVPAIRTRGGERVVKELASLGYDCRWDHLSAFDMGAPHKRERWFLLAHGHGHGREIKPQRHGGGSTRGWAFGNHTHGFRDVLPDTGRDLLRNQSRRRGGQSRDGSAIPRVNGTSQSVADARGLGWHARWRLGNETPESETAVHAERRGEGLADARGARLERVGVGAGGAGAKKPTTAGGGSPIGRGWEIEPDVGRVVNGLPHRVDRIKCLGNAVVPAQAREAFRRLAGLS